MLISSMSLISIPSIREKEEIIVKRNIETPIVNEKGFIVFLYFKIPNIIKNKEIKPNM